MNKPYNTSIIEAMAQHSDACAAYASAMKWDWLRRQKVGDVGLNNIKQDCAFCKRWPSVIGCGNRDCLLYKIQDKGCDYNDETLWAKVRDAYLAKDQQAFTQNANDLYFQIRSIIDDFYKPEPKKEEVFYRMGQKFKMKPHGNRVFVLTQTGYSQSDCSDLKENMAALVCEGNSYSGSHKIRTAAKVTEAEFKKISGHSTFALIADKK